MRRNLERPHQSRRHFQDTRSPYMGVPPPPPPPPPPAPTQQAGHVHHHMHHPHIHPRHPTAAVALVTPGPTAHSHHLQQPQSHLLSSQLHQEPADQSTLVHPRILSWQMSQSLNGYPWRMQAGNVPFFTFPSTPPSFLPANSYPYTFAPAPPFSINQITQVPTTAVPVPSYAGIAVPQATAVDSIVAGPNGASFPVAAMSSLPEVPSEHLRSVPPGAVAVTISSNTPVPGQPPAATVVIQQPVLQPSQEANPATIQGQDMTVIHTIRAPPAPPHAHYQAPAIPGHIAPAIITADGTQAHTGVLQNPGASEAMTVGRYHGPIVAALPPQLVSVGAPQHSVVGMSLDYTVNSTQDHSEHLPRAHSRDDQTTALQTSGSGATPSHFPSHSGAEENMITATHSRTLHDPRRLAVVSDLAGPSRSLDSDSPSDNDSLDSNSPGQNFIFYSGQAYLDNDSDDSLDNPESSDSMVYGHDRELSELSADSQISSDDDSASPSESEGNSPTNPSTMRFVNSNTAAVVSSVNNILPDESAREGFLPDENGNSEPPEAEADNSSSESNPLSLPVLINISDSDSLNSHVSTPTHSVIDLTMSSVSDSPTVSESAATTSTVPALPNNPTVQTNQQVIESNNYNEVDSVSAPVFIPVINQQNTEEIEPPQVIRTREAAEYYSAALSATQRATRAEESNTVENQEVHLVSHPVMQMSQVHSHNPQLYTQGQLTSAHAHIITQQQQAPPAHSYTAQRSHDHRTTQAVYPTFPAHLAPPVPAASSLDIQSVALEQFPPTAQAVLPLEPLPPVHTAMLPLESNGATAMPHGGMQVLRWQGPLSQQQHRTGEC